jgi:hypothetical protein
LLILLMHFGIGFRSSRKIWPLRAELSPALAGGILL